MSAVAVIAAAAVSAAFPISVGQERIPLREVEHWERIAAANVGADDTPDRFQRMAFRRIAAELLISFRWTDGEAKRRGIVVGRRAVLRSFRKQRNASFPKRRDYRRFLKQSGQSTADVLLRVRLGVIVNRITARTGSGDAGLLRALRRRWKPRTRCRAPYITSDCGLRVRPS